MPVQVLGLGQDRRLVEVRGRDLGPRLRRAEPEGAFGSPGVRRLLGVRGLVGRRVRGL